MKRNGFTLIELLVVIVILGYVLSQVYSLFPLLAFNQERAYIEKSFESSRGVGLGILKTANESTGRLVEPFNGTAAGKTLAYAPVSPVGTDPDSLSLIQNIQGSGVTGEKIFSDGSFSLNVRVYQRVPNLTKSLPIRGISGDTVNVTYDVGVVYQTQCPQASPCNSSASGAIPGASPIMTSLNYATWITTPPDMEPFFFSTLDYQKRLLDLTMDNISVIIRRIQNDYAYRSISSAPNDITNFYMGPNNTGAPNLSGIANSLTNEGCYDGWYELGSLNVNLLERYGLNRSAYGKTLWGGALEYCRDFDPINSGKNTLPHSAAIRFNKNVTAGNPTVTGQNIVIAF